jgi:predicted nucleotidyltransferase
METPDDDPLLEPRLANTDDLLSLCRFLNEAGAKYIVIGGFAIIQSGFARATSDIDLLIDTSPENFARVKAAMLQLPDGAVREVNAADFDECLVVRVGDEFVVDLLRQACGIRYDEASKDIAMTEIAGVTIPFASPQLLWRTKQTHREKDALDRTFLAELLKKKGIKLG